MKTIDSWDTHALEIEPSKPQILASREEGRLIALFLPAGDELQEHEVHENAWLIIVEGEVSVSDSSGATETGGAGFIARFDPGERHEVRAQKDTRALLMLTPWPGDGHPGPMDLEDKAQARERAREHSQG